MTFACAVLYGSDQDVQLVIDLNGGIAHKSSVANTASKHVQTQLRPLQVFDGCLLAVFATELLCSQFLRRITRCSKVTGKCDSVSEAC